MLVKQLSLVLALLFAFALVGASPAPSKRAPAPHPAPSKRVPAPWPAPSKRAPAPHPAPSKRAPAPAPSKRAPAPIPSFARRAPAPAPAPSKRAAVPEPVPEIIIYDSKPSKPTSSIFACEELNHPSDQTTRELLNIFDVVLDAAEKTMWIGFGCDRVVDGNIVKRDAMNLVSCSSLSDDGFVATGCSRI